MPNRCFLLMILLLSAGEAVSIVSAQTSQEFRIRWNGCGASPASVFSVVEQHQLPSPKPQQRLPEPSPDQLLVVAFDAEGQERDRTFIQDPCVVRAEELTPSGELIGENLYRLEVEFLVCLSDDPTITELRFYHPRWTGSEFIFDLFGSSPTN